MLEIVVNLKRHFIEKIKLILKHIFLFLFITLLSLHQNLTAQTATLTGILLDELNNPIDNVNIQVSQVGTTSNTNGFYRLEIPANKNITVVYSHINYKAVSVIFNLKSTETYEFNPVLKLDIEQIETVVIKGIKRSTLEGVTTIDPKIIRTIKGAQPGVENLLKTLQGSIYPTS